MVIIISCTSMSWVKISCNQKHQDLLTNLKDSDGIWYPRELTLTCFLLGEAQVEQMGLVCSILESRSSVFSGTPIK